MDSGGLYVGAGQVVGVALQGAMYRYVHLVRRRRAVVLRRHGEADSVAALVKAVGTRVPMALCVDHERCVHRVVTDGTTAEERIAKAFPGAATGSMCASLRTQSGMTGCSMMRRDEATALLHDFVAAGARVVDLRIGPWDLLALAPLLAATDEGTAPSGTRILARNGALVLERTAADPAATMFLGGDPLPAVRALAFATAWGHLVPEAARTVIHEDLVLEARSHERARLWYERTLVAGLVLILGLVAAEALLAHQVDRSRAQRDDHSKAMEELRSAVEAARQERTADDALAVAMGLSGGARLSTRAATIAASTPAHIRLDRVQVDPLLEQLEEHRPVAVGTGMVRIQGRCADAALLHAWMDSLRMLPSVAAVRLVGYRPAADDGGPVFDLELSP